MALLEFEARLLTGEIAMAVQSCCFAISPCTVHVTSLYITLLLLLSRF